MNDSIYVVVAYGGQYDEAWQSNKVASFSAQEAQAWIDNKEAEYEAFREKYDAFHAAYDEAHAAWNVLNPTPPIKEWEEIPVPKWQSTPGQKQIITDEMRAERNVIMTENARRRAEAFAEHEAWSILRTEFVEVTRERLAALNGITLEAIVREDRRCGERTNYRIDQVPMVKS